MRPPKSLSCRFFYVWIKQCWPPLAARPHHSGQSAEAGFWAFSRVGSWQAWFPVSGASLLFGANVHGLRSASFGGSLDGGLAARIGFVALRVIWSRPSVRLTGARPFFFCCGPIGCMVGALEPPCLAGEGAPTACCWADIGGGAGRDSNVGSIGLARRNFVPSKVGSWCH